MDDGGESLRRKSIREKRRVKSSMDTREPEGIGRHTRSTVSKGPGDDRRRKKSEAKRNQSRPLYINFGIETPGASGPFLDDKRHAL